MLFLGIIILTIIERLWHHERDQYFDPQVRSQIDVSFAQVSFLPTTVENSEGTASAVAVLWFGEPSPAQNFRRERYLTGCYFAAKTARTASNDAASFGPPAAVAAAPHPSPLPARGEGEGPAKREGEG
jgi:hypothetical protein